MAGWLRGLLLRAVAALPDGALRVAPVDGATLGAVFAPFRALVEAEAWRRPAIDLPGLHEVLDEAEERIERQQSGDRDPTILLIACAALPPGTGRGEWSRLAAIGHAGPSAGVYLLVAGYPPAQHPGLEAAPHLEHATWLTARPDGLFTVSDGPGPYRFSSDGDLPVGARLNRGPSDHLIETVCRRLAKTVKAQTVTDFAALMPTPIWQESSITGLRTTVGRQGRDEAVLALDDVTPHWLVGGRTGAGKTVFLLENPGHDGRGGEGGRAHHVPDRLRRRRRQRPTRHPRPGDLPFRTR